MIEFSVADALDAHIAATSEDREPDGMYHPSSLFLCERRAIYAVRGILPSNPPDAKTMRVFRVGHEFHRIVQEAVSGSAVALDEGIGDSGTTAYVYHEIELHSPRLNLKGSADTVRFYLDDEAEELLVEVIEYKSIKEASLKYGKELPKPDHVQQALTYAYILRHEVWWTPAEYDETAGMCPNCQTPWKCNGPHEPPPPRMEMHRPLGDRLRHVRICYVGKESIDVREFLVEITDEGERALERYIAHLDLYRLSGVSDSEHRLGEGDPLPPRLPVVNGKKHWLCASYCDWRDRCWNVDSVGVEL